MTSSSVRLPFFIVLAASLAMSAVTVADARPIYANARQQLGGQVSSNANFLVGRYAMTQGDINTASAALSAAASRDPTDMAVRERAFLVGILGGDIEGSAVLAPGLVPITDTSRFMQPMVLAVAAVKSGKTKVARDHIDAALAINGRARSALLLKPYGLAMAGQWKVAVDASADAPPASDRDRLVTMLVQSERARILELKGRHSDAEAIYTSLYQAGPAAFIFGPDFAAFLERRGRKDDARKVWSEVVTQSNDTVAVEAVRRIDSARYAPPTLPNLTQSMAQALFMAATLSFSERDTEMALATLRLSLYLDPTSERARVFLGQIQHDLRDPAAADAAWASIPDTSPFAGEATLRRVWSLRAADADDAAMALLDQALVRTPDDLGLVMEKASLLHGLDDDAGALAVLDGRRQRVGDDDFTWQTWFLQAMIYDGIDQWDQAEAAITKARALNGSRPEVLNFLGYGWISRGLKVEEGMDLVRQALAANPKSGAIMDSLGWGYYKMGNYEQALSHIEQAIQLSPSDAEINEHLGDVYKALGRDIEAQYEWRRVLTLDASAKQQAAVRLKLQAYEKADATAADLPRAALAAASEASAEASSQMTPLRQKASKPQ